MLTDNTSKVTSCFLADTERLASKWANPQLPVSNAKQRTLPVVVKELVTALRGNSEMSSDLDFETPDLGESSFGRAAEQSSLMDESIIELDTGPIHEPSSSTGPGHVTIRQPGEDPLWAIADVMVGKVEDLLSHAIKERATPSASPYAQRARTSDMLHATRVRECKVGSCMPESRCCLPDVDHSCCPQTMYEVVSQRGSRKRKSANFRLVTRYLRALPESMRSGLIARRRVFSIHPGIPASIPFKYCQPRLFRRPLTGHRSAHRS